MSDLTNLTEGDLVRLMAKGSEEAFVTVYRKHQSAIYRFALQMSGSPGVAEEVTQEVFLALIRGAGRYDNSRGPLISWLFGIARNQVVRCLERDGRYLPMERDDLDEAVDLMTGSQADSPLEDLTHSEALESIRQAVLALPAPYREAVVLCDLQEMSYEEAAHVLKCAVGTVRSRLHRGRALLLNRLRAQGRCRA